MRCDASKREHREERLCVKMGDWKEERAKADMPTGGKQDYLNTEPGSKPMRCSLAQTTRRGFVASIGHSTQLGLGIARPEHLLPGFEVPTAALVPDCRAASSPASSSFLSSPSPRSMRVGG